MALQIKTGRQIYLAALLAAVLLLVGFSAAFAQTTTTLTINLGAQNNSGQNGTATLTDIGGGRTRVVINVSSGGAGVTQPAHIHDGTCATLGGVKYPLSGVVDGKSTTDVTATIDQLTAGTFAINIHKSAQEVSVYTSCGNVKASAVAAPTSAPATGAGGTQTQAAYPPVIAIATLLGIALAGFVVLRRRSAR